MFLDTEFGPAVLRQYLRGGQVARVSRDRYVFTGFEKSRPVKEFSMLERLSGQGLPVPGPLAAMCIRDGVSYRGWLMTRKIPHASPLADLIPRRLNAPELWRAAGECIRRFHDHGVIHADLNARNVLVDAAGEIHLVDFDKARAGSNDARAFRANLERLHRSLQKLWPRRDRDALNVCWRILQEGYHREGVPA